MTTSNQAPKWVVWLLIISIVFFPLVMYWLANHYSGWSKLKRIHNAENITLQNSQGRTHVTLIQPSGRKYNFASSRSGGSTYARTEVGFDDLGFWIKGTHGGWSGGPVGAVHIPWTAVNRCEVLRIHLFIPSISLIIQDQKLLDQCECIVANRCT